MTAPPLTDALQELRDAVAAAPLGLVTPSRDTTSRTARAVVDQVDDYLLPRLRDLDAPLLAVVGGSTGAGKSTLVNSVLGARVTAPGVLRPTTRSPVLVCSPVDRAAFSGDRVLPGLARTTGEGDVTGGLRLVTTEALPPGLALVDAPDVDSVVEANRDLAGQLLSAADLWVFVTTAARYADAVPWDLLRTAQERGTALAVVLDRTPPEAVTEVAADLAAMLQRGGLGSARLFVVEERPLTDGFLPEAQVAPLRDWLRGLAADQEQRAAVVRQTLAGALESLDGRVAAVAAGVDEQAAAANALRSAADAAYDGARDAVSEGVSNGSLLRGEVLARWQDFVGTGEWMRSLQTQVGRLRDRLAAALTGRPTSSDSLQGALESGVETLLRAEADRAADRTVTAWRSLPGGPGLLTGREEELSGVSPDFAPVAAEEVRDWQGYVLDLVREEGAGKRSQARLLSWGVNGAGAVVMVAVFASTAGLSGAELAIAGGTTAVGQRVLEAVFGDAAVRALATRARADLDARADRLLRWEEDRFEDLLTHAAPADDAADRLRAAVATLAAARGAAA
ncbi:energy-coupling factor transporter ATP-binding protein EcfA2 [Geodermatophilus bullaregiensis]|uniref:GTPase domain-containing protein n=1 Tax=Geodermatophilus bullaregiensis TaxID=1564160 RepID=UPI0019565414|nr:GTPase domain-containing protein [Geodermatophilus bullaregiensis]MBM7807154.1 energy-coupling factor transporter ATP-binding protein EcfA2 [Geodermatophilus bullaregiensis]